MFDFSNSLSNAAPVSPILLSVCVKRKQKSGLLMDVFCVSFFCIHNSGRVQRMLCLISMIHSAMLFLYHQCGCLYMIREKEKSDLLMNVFCVSSFFCLHDSV